MRTFPAQGACESQEHPELHTERFPHPAGVSLGHGTTHFEALRQARDRDGQGVYHPFPNKDEWQLADNLMTSRLSQQKVDKLLKVPVVSSFTGPTNVLQQLTLKILRSISGMEPPSITHDLSSSSSTHCPQSDWNSSVQWSKFKVTS
jgi:hypothetical protein